MSSPKWDSRNSSFIPPTQLQQFKANTPSHHFTSHSSQDSTMQVAQHRPQPSSASSSPSHTRSSSFFSFNRKQPSSPNDQQQHQRSPSLNGSMGSQQAQQPPQTPPSQHQPPQSPPLAPQSQQQPPLQLHPEIRSVVQLNATHAHKVYFSGPLVRRIERDANGHKPARDEGWTEVWAQLGGTTLSLWDMNAINQASQEGKEVPPTYINMTDAFIQVLGAISIPVPGSPDPQRQENVLTLNTAGSNLLFFACPNTNALISWASALRLAAWEKSRLEEIYTAHLIRITLSARDIPSTLNNGRLEGWVRIRIAGQTDWKSVWMVITAGAETTDELGRINSDNNGATNPLTTNVGTGGKMRRMSNLFSAKDHNGPNALPPKANITVYTSQKPKDKRKPLLTITDVTQAFAVYPERPELITRSTLVKLEGTLGQEELAGGMRGREGWLLVMPQLEGNLSPAAEMLKWVIAFHDAFKLYGRPQAWTWDPRDPVSLMFGYPVGPHKDLLFLDREQAERFDPREERTSAIRARFLNVLNQKMQQQGSPIQPTHQRSATLPQNGGATTTTAGSRGPQLPPLSFDRTDQQQERHLLTPITEKSSVYTHGRSMSGDAASMLGPKPSLHGTTGAENVEAQPIPEEPRTPPLGHEESSKFTAGPLSVSPPGSSRGRSPPPPPVKDGLTSSRSTDSSSFNASLAGTRVGPSTGRTSFDRDSANVRSSSPLASPRPPSSSKPGSVLSSVSEQNKPQSPISVHSAPSVPPRLPSPGAPSFRDPPRLPSPGAPSIRDRQPERPRSPPGSILTSPYSPTHSTVALSLQPSDSPTKSMHRAPSATASTNASRPSSIAPSASMPSTGDDEFGNEAGALYYMQQQQQQLQSSYAGRMPTTIAETDRDDEGDDSSAEFSGPTPTHTQGPSAGVVKPVNNASSRFASGGTSPVVRQGTPMAFVERGSNRDKKSDIGSADERPSSGGGSVSSVPTTTSVPSRPGPLGRKPSGARAQQTQQAMNSRMNLSGNIESPSYLQQHQQQPPVRRPAQVEEDEEEEEDTMGDFDTVSSARGPGRTASPPTQKPKASSPPPPPAVTDDSSLDVLAALSYLDVADASEEQLEAEKNVASPTTAASTAPLRTPRATSASPTPTPVPVKVAGAKSSFAPSTKAAERKAKAQAQQAAAAAAISRPGRVANGKRKMRSAKAGEGAWSSDEDEEDDEDEGDDDEDDEEVDSDGEPTAKTPSAPASSNNSVRPPGPGGDNDYSQQPPHLRPPRTLPQVPPGRPVGEYIQSIKRINRSENPEGDEEYMSRRPSEQYSQMGRSMYYEDNMAAQPHPQPQSQPHHPQPTAPRHNQNIWNQVLDPNRTSEPPSNGRDTFVQLEPPSQTMTKAFTPQGLLSAGLQDKQDRSAKRQEELARESGASLINVPNKPPPPQTGLLGAITAHERERKREGGMGAALTEREREKRMAEERQRRFDDAQRQQLDQMQQGGSLYGGQFGMNPMMMGMNPMMMGMNPMMTGGMGMNPMMTGGGMNPMMTGYSMMPGFNPQQMFAAQQAAQAAYQQAMMAFSSGGSQVGGDGNGNGASPQMNPMMTGNGMMGMGGMGMGMGNMGFDPRMSMMGMGNPMMNPMSMQMTGMSQFDPRFPPTNTPSPMNELTSSLLNPGAMGGNSPSLTPNNPSPAGRGSPLARPVNEQPDGGARGSRPTSPKPQ
ncbi:hypothetical protein VNI00_004990 [Paramarasmius palmivorus]|uniref:PH domain-containing protein n=1 Tax=Paramarasmius palmivorus TaxID=297713 RepID=A0AAW0DHM1_9AGAR